MIDYVALSFWDLALTSVLVLIDAALSILLRLNIHPQPFDCRSAYGGAACASGDGAHHAFCICLTAVDRPRRAWHGALRGREIAQRQELTFSGLWSFGIGTLCMMIASGLVTSFALLTAVRPDPWYDPRYAIPLLGMILGNCMTGIALGLDTLTSGATAKRTAVEAKLMLGGTRFEAMQPVMREALRRALLPIINSMSATGVVSLPGMMTGQILGGVAPAEAVRTQILIMFLIVGGTGLGAVAAVLGGVLRLTDNRASLAAR